MFYCYFDYEWMTSVGFSVGGNRPWTQNELLGKVRLETSLLPIQNPCTLSTQHTNPTWNCKVVILRIFFEHAWLDSGKVGERSPSSHAYCMMGLQELKAKGGHLVFFRGSFRDWSLQCPSNAFWPFKIHLSKHNPKLKIKTSHEVFNIICPP